MVTVDGDCRVNKSDENKWLDWRGMERGERGRYGIEQTGDGNKLEERDSLGEKVSRGLERED